MWVKLAKWTDFQSFFGYFHVFKVVEQIKDMRLFKKIEKFHFWSFLPIFSHIL
jgi:hypothetical protein